jgi:peptidoglycan/xylan/chitin deacetylase (PgdA/CDA1 family)
MSRVKRAGLWMMRAVGLFALMRRLTGRGVRILCYHGAWRGPDDFPGDAMFIRGETFTARLDALARLGYPVVSLDAALAGLAGTTPLPRAAVVLTIDDGWYSFYSDMLPALRSRSLPATLYVDTGHLLSRRPVPHVMARYFALIAGGGEPAAIAAAADRSLDLDTRLGHARALGARLGLDPSGYVERRVFDYMAPEDLAAAAADGLDVQLHSHHHTLGDFGAEIVIAEVARNRAELARLLGTDPAQLRHFCYPSGAHDRSVGPILAGLDIASATTTEAGIAYPSMDRFFLPRLLDGENLSLVEFEAELAGIGDLLRAARAAISRRFVGARMPGRNSRPT